MFSFQLSKALTKRATLVIILSALSTALLTDAIASTGAMHKSISDMYDRQTLRSSYSLYIDRDMQSVIERVGWQITQKMPKRKVTKDYNFIILDNHLVDVFHSDATFGIDLDSHSLYLTRGLITLANHEGHLAAAIALKVAQFETDKVRPGHIFQRVIRAASELNVNKKRGERIFQRAAKLMAQANYDPAVLLDWVLIARRYQNYQRVDNNERLQTAYLGFTERQFVRAIKALKKAVKSLHAERKQTYIATPVTDFMNLLDGLRYGSSAVFHLSKQNFITLKQSGFRVYLPQNIHSVESTRAQEMFPFNFTILGQPNNNSFTAAYQYNSQNDDGYSAVMAWAVIDELLLTTPEKRLAQYIQDHSKELTIIRQQAIQGPGWQGAFIKAKVVTTHSSSAMKGVTIRGGAVNVGSEENYALVPVAGKMVVLRQGPLINETQFLTVVSNIRALSEENRDIRSVAAEYRLTIKTVQANDTIASLSQGMKIQDAAMLLRILNGLPLDGEPIVGQLIKVVDAR